MNYYFEYHKLENKNEFSSYCNFFLHKSPGQPNFKGGIPKCIPSILDVGVITVISLNV